jgi:hypothetical protein
MTHDQEIKAVHAFLARQRSVRAPEDQMPNDEAMRHLGEVLFLLSSLAPEDRCRALDDAQAFWEAKTGMKIEPSGCGVKRLVHHIPVLDDL